MKIKVKEFYPNGTSFYTGWIATIFFITFGNLPKASVIFNKARANLREIARIIPDTRPAGYAKIRSRRIFPEDASVRKPPLKRKSAATNGH